MNIWLRQALSLENRRALERYPDEETFLRIHPDPGRAWAHCPRIDWMLHLLERPGEVSSGWELGLRRVVLKGWLEGTATSTELDQERGALGQSADELCAEAVSELVWRARPAQVGSIGRGLVLCALAPLLRGALGLFA